ncbi:MAG: MATE family efflux transporter [Oscillospiraceae bacterium]|nr:MATE family efflux transporter [Oscillospiraceae bacterium]
MSLVGMIDTVMVGGLGAYAIAAVGLTNQPRFLFMALFFAMNVGVTAVVSRRKGEGNRSGANVCLFQSILITGAMSVAVGILAVALSGQMLLLAGAKDDAILPATQYFQIVSSFMPVTALTMAVNAAQRGVGNTSIAFRSSVSANLVNMTMNYLLIEGRFGFPRLEVRGAAIATVIGNCVGLLIALLSLIPKDSYLNFRLFGKLSPDIPTITSISRIGGNAVVEQIFLRVGFMLYARVIADLGTSAFAAHQISMQMLGLTFTIGDGLAVACSSLVGQNLGKKRPDLSIIYGKIGQRLALCASAVMFSVAILSRYAFAGMFTDDPALIEVCAGILIIMAVIQPFQTSQVVMAGSLRGAGDTRFVAITMLFTVAIMRPLCGYLFAVTFGWGLAGAWYAILVDQILRLYLLQKRFGGGKWIGINL